MPRTRRAFTFTVGGPPAPAQFSINDGAVWNPVSTPSPNGLYDRVGTLWSIETTDRRLRRSPDDGQTWETVGIAIPGTATIQNGGVIPGRNAIIVIVQDATTIYAAVTTNEGASWTIFSVIAETIYRPVSGWYNPGLNDFCIIQRKTAGDFLHKILRSADNGQTWTPVLSISQLGVPNEYIDSLFVTQQNTWLAVSVQQGSGITRVFRSPDGITWTETMNLPPAVGAVNRYNHSKCSQTTAANRIRLARRFFSVDDGQTWADDGQPEAPFESCAGSTLNALLERRVSAFVDDIFRSVDQGATWVYVVSVELSGSSTLSIDSPVISPAERKAKKYGGFPSPFIPVPFLIPSLF